MPRIPKPCGTNAAYGRHIAARETPCDPCRKAHARYREEYRKRRYVNRDRGLKVDALGTKRRIRALVRMGWRHVDIAEATGLGVTGDWTVQVMRTTYVYEQTARAIQRAYESLSAKAGPSQKNREYALRKGWPPPFAWDDIDDPNCKARGFLRPSDYKKLKNGRA